jgi:hypothetical protein
MRTVIVILTLLAAIPANAYCMNIVGGRQSCAPDYNDYLAQQRRQEQLNRQEQGPQFYDQSEGWGFLAPNYRRY